MKNKQFKSSPIAATRVAKKIVELMNDIYEKGKYPFVDVINAHNLVTTNHSGEFAMPLALKYYLVREFSKILSSGNIIQVEEGRNRRKKSEVGFMDACEEETNHYKKKLFLFSPERIELSCDRLSHYTNSDISDFQEYVLVTNYQMHMDIFKKMFPKAVGSKGACQMPVLHAKKPGRKGITIINMGVGPANAKTLTDQIAVLRPSCIIMIGHCGGLRPTQEIGNFLLADRYIRDDHVLEVVLPKDIPISSTLVINNLLLDEIQKKKITFQIGTIFTTNNRDWEYKISHYRQRFAESRSHGIDMESSVICAQGFRYKIPHATLLMISDRPLHGKPKLAGASKKFYQENKKVHVQVAVNAINKLSKMNIKNLNLAGLEGVELDSVMR